MRLAHALPAGAGLIHRGFGRAAAEAEAQALAEVARRRNLVLLIGADAALAARTGADGVHLPERLAPELPRLRARFPRWILTLAAHSPAALAKAQDLGADAALLSVVFASRSASAARVRPLGPLRLAQMARHARTPVIALGGVSARTAPRLLGTGVAGLAAVDAFRTGTGFPDAPGDCCPPERS